MTSKFVNVYDNKSFVFVFFQLLIIIHKALPEYSRYSFDPFSQSFPILPG